jgi:hypothetical protein
MGTALLRALFLRLPPQATFAAIGYLAYYLFWTPLLYLLGVKTIKDVAPVPAG